MLLHLADRFQESYPLASHCIRSNFYVDDTGADNLEDAVAKREQICSLLSKAGMNPRTSNTWAEIEKMILLVACVD